NRRRSRLSSATYAPEQRWRPSKMIVVMAIGLLIGVIIGVGGRMSSRGPSIDDQYLVLTGALYDQGVSASSIRQRLVDAGFANPSAAVMTVADRLQISTSQQDQRQAESLQQLARAL